MERVGNKLCLELFNNLAADRHIRSYMSHIPKKLREVHFYHTSHEVQKIEIDREREKGTNQIIV